MQAREADTEGFIERDGVRIDYEVHGTGPRTILLLPTWTVIHKRFWKLQVPYLARHFRVVIYDGPGNGHSDRSLDPRAYDRDAQVRYIVDVLDATATERAVVVGMSVAPSLGPASRREPPHPRSRFDIHRTVGRCRGRSCTAGRCWRVGHPAAIAGPVHRSRPRHSLGKGQPSLLARELRGLLVVLLRKVFLRGPLHEADRRCRLLGTRNDPGGHHRIGPGEGHHEARSRRALPIHHLSGAVHPWRPGRPQPGHQVEAHRGADGR